MDVLFTRKEVRKYHLFGSRVLQGRGGEDITVNNKYLLPLMKRCRGKTTSACVISEFIFIHLQRFLILKNSNFYLFIYDVIYFLILQYIFNILRNYLKFFFYLICCYFYINIFFYNNYIYGLVFFFNNSFL